MSERVFISYSSEDMQWAEMIKENLDANGIPCWMANRGGIAPGEDYIEAIVRALEDCDVFILVLSENAEKSAWVSKELGTAITKRKKIIPVKISDYQIRKFQFQLENIQIFQPGNLAEVASQINLVNAVKKALDLKEVDANSFVSHNASDSAGQNQKKKTLLPVIAGAAVVVVLAVGLLLGKTLFSSKPQETGKTVQQPETDTSGTEKQSVVETAAATEPLVTETTKTTEEPITEIVTATEQMTKDSEAETEQPVTEKTETERQSAAETTETEPLPVTEESEAETQTESETISETQTEPETDASVDLLEAALSEEMQDERFFYDGDYKETGMCSEDGTPQTMTLTVPKDGYYFFEMRLARNTYGEEFTLTSDLPFLADVSALPEDFFDAQDTASGYICAAAKLPKGEYKLTTNAVRCRPILTPMVTYYDPGMFDTGSVYGYFTEEPCKQEYKLPERASGNLYFYGGAEGGFLERLELEKQDGVFTIEHPAGIVVLDARYAVDAVSAAA